MRQEKGFEGVVRPDFSIRGDIRGCLEKRKEEGLLRQLLQIPEGVIDFASNNYLGIKIELQALQLNGATGSRLLTGNSSYLESLEAKIAQFHQVEAATLFNCGYMANLGLFAALRRQGGVIIYDAEVHASIKDGIRLGGRNSESASAFAFRHNDLNHLERRLQSLRASCSASEYSASGCGAYVIVESVYSTDGSQAPLEQIAQLVEEYQVNLIVDEAHAVGVMGVCGQGAMSIPCFAKVVTFGKALGCQGAAVLGSELLKQFLLNFAHTALYTTAPSFPLLYSIEKAYELFPTMENERRRLRGLIAYFKQRVMTSSATHIQPIYGKDWGTSLGRSLSSDLHRLDLRVLRRPTVPRGKELIRVTLHAFNTEEEIDQLVNVLKCELLCKQ